MKVMIIRSTTEEYKERSKKSIIEGALQKVVSENKKSEKDSFNEKLKANTTMVIDQIIKNLRVKNVCFTMRLYREISLFKIRLFII